MLELCRSRSTLYIGPFHTGNGPIRNQINSEIDDPESSRTEPMAHKITRNHIMSSNYWNCACEHKFMHSINSVYCPACNHFRDECKDLSLKDHDWKDVAIIPTPTLVRETIYHVGAAIQDQGASLDRIVRQLNMLSGLQLSDLQIQQVKMLCISASKGLGSEVATMDEYWDCECKYEYIHEKAHTTYCPTCDRFESDMPDSRVNEVGLPNLMAAPVQGTKILGRISQFLIEADIERGVRLISVARRFELTDWEEGWLVMAHQKHLHNAFDQCLELSDPLMFDPVALAASVYIHKGKVHLARKLLTGHNDGRYDDLLVLLNG